MCVVQYQSNLKITNPPKFRGNVFQKFEIVNLVHCSHFGLAILNDVTPLFLKQLELLGCLDIKQCESIVFLLSTTASTFRKLVLLLFIVVNGSHFELAILNRVVIKIF